MTSETFIQLGVAGVIALVLTYILKLILDGRLHVQGEIDLYMARIKDRDERIRDLMAELERTTDALSAANHQSTAIIDLWKALQERLEEP